MGLGAIPVGIAAFLAYRVAVTLGLRRPELGAARDGPAPPVSSGVRLPGAHGSACSTRSRSAGASTGPSSSSPAIDVAARTVDPGDFLAFVGGRLADQYVAGPEAVRARLAALDVAPDPDGRFRVNEFYCHDDTWRPTVQALLEASDRVLMDVRSFSERNQGCRFELEQLIWRLPSDAIVLVVDKGTDVVRLGATLDGAWRAAREANRARGDGRLALVRVERAGRPEVRLIMECLRGTGTPARVLAGHELAAAGALSDARPTADAALATGSDVPDVRRRAGHRRPRADRGAGPGRPTKRGPARGVRHRQSGGA